MDKELTWKRTMTEEWVKLFKNLQKMKQADYWNNNWQ